MNVWWKQTSRLILSDHFKCGRLITHFLILLAILGKLITFLYVNAINSMLLIPTDKNLNSINFIWISKPNYYVLKIFNAVLMIETHCFFYKIVYYQKINALVFVFTDRERSLNIKAFSILHLRLRLRHRWSRRQLLRNPFRERPNLL